MGNSDLIIIKGGRVIDPSREVDRVADVAIGGGVFLDAVRGAEHEFATVIDAAGMVVAPGFVDLHTHLREPGFEYKETIESGTSAAVRGGFTTVCGMPNTSPVADTRAVVDYVVAGAAERGSARVLPIGAVTKGSRGDELAEMGELAEAGVVGFSDDGHPVSDANIMRQAISYASALGLPIINHAETLSLSRGGAMNEGWVATRLGLKGIPSSAEEIMVARDVELARLVGGRLHVAHVSAAGSVDIVRRAKEDGIRVTCEVTPHHLTLTDEAVMGLAGRGGMFAALSESAYDTSAKVSPPLRSRHDVEALRQALRDGVIDVIATDHAPHGVVDKHTTFAEAASGISNLETAFGSLAELTRDGALSMFALIDRLSTAPARLLGRDDLGTLRPGAPADVVILDPDHSWVVDTAEFASKGKNTPLAGATLTGRVVATFVGGEARHGAEILSGPVGAP